MKEYLEIAARKPNCAAILVLIDTDRDCPKTLAEQLAQRAREVKLRVPIAVVCAHCEYEVWFLASLATIVDKPIKGRPGILKSAVYDYNNPIEGKRNVKGWLTEHMPPGRSYKETEDQAAFTTLIDFALARQHSRSFRRLEHALVELLDAIQSGQTSVTPSPRDN